LAGLAVGFWKDTRELATHWRVERRFEPAMKADKAEELRRRWTAAVERAREWETS